MGVSRFLLSSFCFFIQSNGDSDMYYLMVKFNFPDYALQYIPVDGKKHVVGYSFKISCKDNGDGTFTVHSYSSEKENPNNEKSTIVPVEYERVVKEGEECRGLYSYQKWSYLEGCYNSHYAFSAIVVREKVESEREDKVRNSIS